MPILVYGQTTSDSSSTTTTSTTSTTTITTSSPLLAITTSSCVGIETLCEWSDCTDTCGSCGVHMRTRVCLTTDVACRCNGSGTQLDYCNLEICRYPRISCCFNKTVIPFNGRFACLDATPTG